MKCKLHTLLCLSLLLIFSACGQDDDPILPLEGNRTVLVYLMGDNSLSSYTTGDIKEMMEGMKLVDSSLNSLLVYVDGNGSTPVLYHIYKNKRGEVQKDVIKEYEEQVSTDPKVMKEVILRTFSEYPADSYGLVLWSHGEGWIPNPLPLKKVSTRWIGQDITEGQHYLNITDMASLFKSISVRWDFILFDACFGQSIEVAYELRDCADYIIGSPTEIPGPGAPYDKVVPAMFSSGDFAKKIGEAYISTYADNFDEEVASNPNAPWEDAFGGKWISGASVSVIKCAALEELASMTKQTLAEVEPSILLNSDLYDYDKRKKNSLDYVGYYDMKQLMELILKDTSEWNLVLANAIIYWNSTPINYSSYCGCFSLPKEITCGVSHYLPLSSKPAAAAAYRSTAWYEAAGLSNLGW